MRGAARLIEGAMRRTSGALIGAAVALAAGGVVAFGSTRMAARRAGAQATYDEALHGVRREAARPDGVGAPAGAMTELCVRGPEGLAAAATRTLGATVRTPDGALDGATLARVSRVAFAAARDREDAIGAPALPQRMGFVDGAAAAPRETCAGQPAWARASVIAGPAPAVAQASPAAAKKKKSSKSTSKSKSAKSPAH
jgi:hypothetical protein